jgi:hypothetical protein
MVRGVEGAWVAGGVLQIRDAAKASKKMAKKAGKSAKLISSSLTSLDANGLLELGVGTKLQSLGKFRKSLHALLVRARYGVVALSPPPPFSQREYQHYARRVSDVVDVKKCTGRDAGEPAVAPSRRHAS